MPAAGLAWVAVADAIHLTGTTWVLGTAGCGSHGPATRYISLSARKLDSILFNLLLLELCSPWAVLDSSGVAEAGCSHVGAVPLLQPATD